MSKITKGHPLYKPKANAGKTAKAGPKHRDTITLISAGGNRKVKRPQGIPSYIDSYMDLT
jgi:hypothetical protein|tara:strand:- start:7169 stop:7348 length:180 start_codon:yes stop_codon:yes gene_type:complete